MTRKAFRTVVPYALAALAVAVAAASGSAATSARSPIYIESKTVGGTQGTLHTGTFKLTWNYLDKGKVQTKVGDYKSAERDGQPYELITTTDTLVGARGTLVMRNRNSIGVSAGSGYSVITGRWSVVRGTGAYAGVRGGGRTASVVLPAKRGKITSFSENYGFLITR